MPPTLTERLAQYSDDYYAMIRASEDRQADGSPIAAEQQHQTFLLTSLAKTIDLRWLHPDLPSIGNQRGSCPP